MINWQARVQVEIDRARASISDPMSWSLTLERKAQERDMAVRSAENYLAGLENSILALHRELDVGMPRVWRGPAAERRFQSCDPHSRGLGHCRGELVEIIAALRQEAIVLPEVARAMRAGVPLPPPFV